jgi:hypothetical protein
MLSTLDTAALQAAVADYFAGERLEMSLILAGSALFTGLAAWLWVSSRSGVAAAFVITVIAIAPLLSATAGSLLGSRQGSGRRTGSGLRRPEAARVPV